MSTPQPAVGYVTDTTYPDNFFRELSPVWLNYVAALNGVRAVDLTRPFTYLELGCGFGTSTIVNAGAFPHATFYACDINAAHVAAGTTHAAELGLENIQVLHCDFAQLLDTALPDFDFIVLHGIYSWVDAPARAAIGAIIRARLRDGGLLYNSYNCMPGWAAETPLRRLLVELAGGAPGDTTQRTVHAMQTLQQLQGNLRYVECNPEARAAIEAYERAQARGAGNYLSHEFLNSAWEVFYSVDVADAMQAAGLTYAGSATLPDNHPMLIIDDAAAEAVNALSSARQRHLAMDFAANRRFRRDVFVRGTALLSPADTTAQLNAAVIGSIGDPLQIPSTVRVPRGEIRFQDDFIGALRQLMQRGSMPLGDAVAALTGQAGSAVEVSRNLIFLMAAGVLAPFARSFASAEATIRAASNSTVSRALRRGHSRNAGCVLPSEVVGNGVALSAAHTSAIVAHLDGGTSADAPINEQLANLARLGLVK